MAVLVPSPSTMTPHSTERWGGGYVTAVAEAGIDRSFTVLPSHAFICIHNPVCSSPKQVKCSFL